MKKFGWCIDNHHEQCRGVTSSPDNALTCDCTCHDAADEVRGDYAADNETDLREYGVAL